jgi:hypothetical protein
MYLSPIGPKIIVEIVIVIILVTWAIHLLVLRPLNIASRQPISIAFPQGVFEAEGLFGAYFLFLSISGHNGFNAVVKNARGWLHRLVEQTILNVVRLLKEVIVLLRGACCKSLAQDRLPLVLVPSPASR